ncbi:hypothetical protein Q5752_001673 [Cryptotrichosporon argae]
MPLFNLPSFNTLANPLNLFNNDPSPTATPGEAGPSTVRQVSTGSSSPGLSVPELAPVAAQRRSSGGSVVIQDYAEREGRGEDREAGLADRRRRRAASALSGVSGVSGVSGATAASGRRRKAGPVETFVIVKPPVTANKNPLNLQVQLVVSTRRAGRERSESGISLASQANTVSLPTTPSRPSVDLPEQSVDLADTEQVESPIAITPASATTASFPDDALKPEAGTALKRSSSVHSTSSNRSSLSTSASSVAGGKRIIPLYNLAVHNVMQPTSVTDAGTDMKVAKFLKRNLEINGVGILEPAEVWHPYPVSHAGSPAASDDGHNFGGRRPASVYSALSPAATRVAGEESKRSSLDIKHLKLDGLVSEDGATKKFFGKMFKKRSSADAAAPSSLSLLNKKSPSKSFSSTDRADVRASVPLPQPAIHVRGASANIVVDTTTLTTATTGYPTFGLAPWVIQRRTSGTVVDLNGAIVGLTTPPTDTEDCEPFGVPPSSRPVGYTWTVRKWSKRNTEGWAASLVAAAAAGLEFVASPSTGDAADDVVFEWVKLRGAAAAMGSDMGRRNSMSSRAPRSRPTSVQPLPRRVSDDAVADSPGGSRTSLTLKPPSRRSASPLPPSTVVTPSSPNMPLPASPNPSFDPRPGPVRRASASATTSPGPSRPSSPRRTATGADDATSLAPTDDAADDDESDPEDSETPWTCSVWVRRTGERQLLATLRPAPHHPKVIGVLSIPQAIHSVALARARARPGHGAGTTSPRAGAGAGTATASARGKEAERVERVASRVHEEVALTEENLKDVVCVTAMWLVAREEFGGLGKRRRA